MMVFVALFLTIGGTFLSAYYWDKKPRLRLSPVYGGTLAGIVYSLFSDKVSGPSQFVTATLLMFFVGWGFYFSVWVQFRESGESEESDK